MRSVLPRNFCTGAHIGGQVLTLEGQTCSLRRAFTTRLAASAGCARKPQFPSTWESDRSSVSRNEHTRERCASTRCLRGGGTRRGRAAGRREPKIRRNMQHTPFPGERRTRQKERHERLQARTDRQK